MTKPKKITEVELVAYVKKWFEARNYTIYSEVVDRGSRADMVAVHNDSKETIILEAKLQANLSLFRQCYDWINIGHKVYAIIVSQHKDRSLRQFFISVLRDYGIGVICALYSNKYGFYDIKIENEANYCIEPNLPTLYEQQKDYSGGANSGGYITPFKITSLKIIEYCKNTTAEITLSYLLDNIETHYKSKSSATQALTKLIGGGVISNVFLYKNKSNKVCVRYQSDL